jgi:hypothetical protein
VIVSPEGTDEPDHTVPLHGDADELIACWLPQARRPGA